MNSTIYLAVVLGSVSASAEPVSVAQSGVKSEPIAVNSSNSFHHWGVLLDAGLPDGLGVSASFRPVYWVRFQLGALENTVSVGARAGVTLIPFNYWITPAVTGEYGHFFEGNANNIARFITNDQTINNPMLQHLNYDFLNAHLGLELGSKRVAFYLRGGVSYVWTTVRNVQQFLRQNANDPSITAQDVHGTALAPSAKLGFIVSFL